MTTPTPQQPERTTGSNGCQNHSTALVDLLSEMDKQARLMAWRPWPELVARLRTILAQPDTLGDGGGVEYREQAEAVIADLRARVSHYEALLVAVREETLTKAALTVDHLFINVRAFDQSYDRGYRQGVQDSAYAIRELRATSERGGLDE